MSNDLDKIAPLRLAEHLASVAMGERCDLVAFSGEANDFENRRDHRGRCPRPAVAIRWEAGFADDVCDRHAQAATERGSALIVRPKRHDGTDIV